LNERLNYKFFGTNVQMVKIHDSKNQKGVTSMISQDVKLQDTHQQWYVAMTILIAKSICGCNGNYYGSMKLLFQTG
jgi:hypothetical protein